MGEKEKPPEVRHFEHEEFTRRLHELEKRDVELTNTLTSGMASIGDSMNNFKLEIVNELRTLERGIAEKTSMDSGLMVQIKDFNRRVDKMETQGDESVKTLAHVTATIDRINDDHKKGMKAFSETLAVHGTKIEKLETASGKTAIAAWKLVGAGIIIPAFVALLIAYLSGRLSL